MRTAPLKERPGSRGDFSVDALLSCVVVLFVNCCAVQTENPGLYIALGNEVYNFLSVFARLKACLKECLSQLPHATIKATAIGIDEHDESRARPCGPGTICLNFQGIVLSHPLLTGTPAIG